MAFTLQHLFQKHFESFASRYRLSRDMYRAAWCIMHCRTAALGGHVNSCPEGHYHQIAYNSCRHRSCPQCQWMAREQWLAGWRNRLLSCPHHHIVFTLPSELNLIWRFNKTEYANTLFAAASETLTELLADRKYLGGRPGLLCALHTWKQTLLPHVHLHCLVSAGGLAGDGRWVAPQKSCLLPRKVLMLKFRGKFKAMLRAKVRCGKIHLPRELPPVAFESLLRRLTAKPWNVKIHDAYRHGRGVTTYLARYLRGGPIHSGRLIADREGEVLFRYRLGSDAGGDGKRQGVMGLPVDAFLGRWLEHVPPRGLQCVRGYGLYSGNQHSRLQAAQRALGVIPDLPSEPLCSSWQERCEAAGMLQVCRCPQCGQRLVSHRPFTAGRPPPRILLTSQKLGQIA